MNPIIRYTRRVGYTKRFLWLLAFALVALIIWIAGFNANSNGSRFALTADQKTGVLQPVMIRPHYQGLDKRNRPFTVIADKGTQLDKDNILLDNVQADITMESGAWMAIKAGTGHMHTPDKHLWLTNQVDLFYEGGYEFRTDHALVDVQAGSAQGDAHIEGQGPTGTLKADSFSAENRGAILHFVGSVITTIYR